MYIVKMDKTQIVQYNYIKINILHVFKSLS